MTVSDMFQSYLQVAKLDVSKMSKIQYTETKRAFFAGVASTLTILIESSEDDEDAAVKVIDNLYTEVQDFWEKQK